MANPQQLCTFYLQGQFFGVPIEQVQEVLSCQEMTRVPLAPGVVQGLINLRGQILTAIDLRRCLGMPPRESGRLMNVVVAADGEAISLLVDEIGDVLAVDRELLEPVPETLHGPARAMVRGVYRLPAHLLLELDIARALANAMACPGTCDEQAADAKRNREHSMLCGPVQDERNSRCGL